MKVAALRFRASRWKTVAWLTSKKSKPFFRAKRIPSIMDTSRFFDDKSDLLPTSRRAAPAQDAIERERHERQGMMIVYTLLGIFQQTQQLKSSPQSCSRDNHDQTLILVVRALQVTLVIHFVAMALCYQGEDSYLPSLRSEKERLVI